MGGREKLDASKGGKESARVLQGKTNFTRQEEKENYVLAIPLTTPISNSGSEKKGKK